MTYKEILKRYWGYDGFRSLQEEITTSVGGGNDILRLMPTGGGKSISQWGYDFRSAYLNAHRRSMYVTVKLQRIMRNYHLKRKPHQFTR